MPVSIEHRYLQRQRAELERERPKEGEAVEGRRGRASSAQQALASHPRGPVAGSCSEKPMPDLVPKILTGVMGESGTTSRGREG